ncbi:hypothetical protein ACH5RR_032238 [Cinchona calisaya]|uniref:Uncharacterized protein n=1 Tax=Cinchona calisaya TaxID=153742 RepID=A0ABD2YHJ3_9GENT
MLKAKYFNERGILNAEATQGSSWTWKSLTSSLTLLESSLEKRVRDEKMVSIWEERWLRNSKDGKVTTTRQLCVLLKVSDLITDRKWIKRKYRIATMKRMLKQS